MAKRVAITQSNYIPWKGYFDLINSVDDFIFYDNAQYTRRDWRNRNLIKTPCGLKWLTIPVATKGKYLQRINQTKVSDIRWPRSHWKTISHNYAHALHFPIFRGEFESLYQGMEEIFLSQINHRFITAINKLLGISTRLRFSEEFQTKGNASERLLGICREIGAEIYVSGPSAKNYLDVNLFEKAGIQVEWMDYEGYPTYRQLHGSFQHRVSVLDLLFNEGADASLFMKSFSKRRPQ